MSDLKKDIFPLMSLYLYRKAVFNSSIFDREPPFHSSEFEVALTCMYPLFNVNPLLLKLGGNAIFLNLILKKCYYSLW